MLQKERPIPGRIAVIGWICALACCHSETANDGSRTPLSWLDGPGTL
jgi:hypothetical protein